MLYTFLAIAVILLAAFVAYPAARILWLSSWFLGWIKGTFAMLLLVLATALGALAYDVYSYKQVLVGQPVATINFESVGEQRYDAVIVDSVSGKQQRFALHGDQWQLDARIIKWQGYFSGFDIKPAFRLDRLSGRFYDIQKESNEKRNTYSVALSPFQLDVWRFVNEHPRWFSVVDANYGVANYLPMRSGALYEINLAKNGLHVRPLNDVASNAMAEWK